MSTYYASTCCRAKIEQREFGVMYCSDCDESISPYGWSLSDPDDTPAFEVETDS